jgi:hypothetical protein
VTEQALGVEGATAVGHDLETPTASDPAARRDEAPPQSAPRPRWRALWVDWRRPVIIAVGATVGFRLIVTWVALVSEYTVSFPHFVARHPSVLWDVLYKWDGGYYIALAAHGYPGHTTAAADHVGLAFYAFGPLYPALVALTHAITGATYELSAELVSTTALVVALAAMWKLLDLDLGVRAADAACVMLLAWPSAFFLVATYPESVTLAAVTLSFLAARRGHFVAAGLLAAAAVAGKSYLVVLLVALAMEVWSAPHDRTSWRAGRDLGWLSLRRVTVGRMVAIVAPSVAFLVGWVAYQRARFDEWFPFVRSQALWNRHFGLPWDSIGRAVTDLVHLRLLDTTTESVAELFDLVTVLLLAVAAVVAYIRVRRSYGVLLGLAWCVFTFQTILQSQSRDVLVLFPFFAALGVWVARHQWRERALLFLFLPCGYFLLERFVTGKFAG